MTIYLQTIELTIKDFQHEEQGTLFWQYQQNRIDWLLQQKEVLQSKDDWTPALEEILTTITNERKVLARKMHLLQERYHGLIDLDTWERIPELIGRKLSPYERGEEQWKREVHACLTIHYPTYHDDLEKAFNQYITALCPGVSF